MLKSERSRSFSKCSEPPAAGRRLTMIYNHILERLQLRCFWETPLALKKACKMGFTVISASRNEAQIGASLIKIDTIMKRQMEPCVFFYSKQYSVLVEFLWIDTVDIDLPTPSIWVEHPGDRLWELQLNEVCLYLLKPFNQSLLPSSVTSWFCCLASKTVQDHQS